jgi:hypothetical protein
VVDNHGQLWVFWVVPGGKWLRYRIGPNGFAAPGAHVAVSQQFGLPNQTDVFVVDKKGQLRAFWVDWPANKWTGPNTIPTGHAGLLSTSHITASQQYGI